MIVSFCKACENSEPHANIMSELVPAQFSLIAEEDRSARVGREREARDRIESSTLFLWWVRGNKYSNEEETQCVTPSSGPRPGNTTYIRIYNTEWSHSQTFPE